MKNIDDLVNLTMLPPLQGLLKVIGDMNTDELNSMLYFAIGRKFGELKERESQETGAKI